MSGSLALLKAFLPSLVELAGLAAVTYGAWLIYPPAGWLTGGGLAVLPAVVRNWPRRSPSE